MFADAGGTLEDYFDLKSIIRSKDNGDRNEIVNTANELVLTDLLSLGAIQGPVSIIQM